MKFIQDKEPDLIIISDSMGEDLGDYCREMRALTFNMRPIIVATSKSAEVSDKLHVLECGADDFISEPINSKEFVSQILSCRASYKILHSCLYFLNSL